MGLLGRRRLSWYTVVVWLSLLLCGLQQYSVARPQSALPGEISDEEFWRIVVEFSEPNGGFRSENFSSNERGYQYLIPRLQRVVRPGGVYMGVGPEQNFQYIAALHPAMAFIIDIRRQNLVQHLMYKAAFEMSDNRADFLARIFSRERPDGLNGESTVEDLIAAYRDTTEDPERTAANLQEIRNWLVRKHKFALTTADERMLEIVVDVFSREGIALNYGSTSAEGYIPPRSGSANQPSFGVLMTLVDDKGENWSFLATEETYASVRDMQRKNLIIPVVGDFGGPKTVRAVGEYIRQHQATVMAFYLSNVEQYLFWEAQNGGWHNFYRSVATLPVDESSIFIRSGNNQNMRGGGLTPVMSSIDDVLRAFNDGRLAEFADVLSLSLY